MSFKVIEFVINRKGIIMVLPSSD